MSKQSDKLADLFFDELPYGEETLNAKLTVKARLAEMAEKLPFPALVENYRSLEKLAVLAGFTPEDAARWQRRTDVLNGKTARGLFRRCRWLAYAAAVLSVFLFTELLWTAFNAVSWDRDFSVTLTLFLLGSALFVTLLLLLGKRTKRTVSAKFDADAYLALRDCSDKYAKRFLNSFALFVAAVFVFEMTELNLYIFGNSRPAEVAESVLSNYLLVAVPLCFVIKNALCLRTVRAWVSLPEKGKLRRHFLGVAIFSAAYWTGAMLVMILFRRGLSYPANFVLISAIIFLFLIALYDLTLRKKLCFTNLVLNRARVAATLVAVTLLATYLGMNRDTWYTQPYINAVPYVGHPPLDVSYDEESGVYTLTASGEDFKILHLTDVHLGGSLFSRKKDLLALEACYAEIEYARPDLVIVTGDLCFPMGVMSMSFNNSAPVYQFAAFMRNVGVPWAFTYGNHDTENLASMKKDQLAEVYQSLSFKTSGTLLYPYVQPAVTGRNNQLIEIRNPDGSLNTALFLVDSNAYTGEGFNTYDYIRDDQVAWYEREVRRLQKEEGGQISSLAFFHIPLQQYRTAYELYLEGSDEVTYHFGENNETLLRKFSCSAYDSSFFEKMVELGSTTGTFCGHDHYNNASITYKGIRLTYGMSIDYLAMPGIAKDTKQRGAEIITLRPDSSWDVAQIPLTSITE